MLDDYKENKFYEYAKNLKKYYHAYLFEVDNLEDSYPLILAFAKTIVCKNHYTNNSNCCDCNICHLIDENYYADLKVIEADGISIKKEQIMELEKSLSLKSSNNTNQVYIIKEAEKLNLSSSNALLKFIEEPEDGIFGIFITIDRNQILPTILSRCNLISLKSLTKQEIPKEEVEYIAKFIKLVHEKKEESLAYLKESFFSKYQKREEVLNSFHIMELIFDNMIHLNYQVIDTLNSNFYDIIDTNLKDIQVNDLIYYLSVVVKFKNKLMMIPNININLFMDRFIIEMSSKVR